MWPWFLSPWWRSRNLLAPFFLPFAPSPQDLREWRVETLPPVFNPVVPFPGRFRASLHRLLIEAGIALTPATTSWDPRSWFALYRYGADFAGTAPLLRWYAGVDTKDPRLTAVGSEEVATGITCYILREYFRLQHIADAYACIQQGQLAYVNANSGLRPDYFCMAADGQTVIAESKGATGTRTSVYSRVDREGWGQVQNVVPVNAPLRQDCGRVVIGTHFCIEGRHGRSETSSLIKDPVGDGSLEKGGPTDQVVRLAYAKSFRFVGNDILAERLLAGRPLPFPDVRPLPKVQGVPILPIGSTPFGDLVGLYGPIANVLNKNSQLLQEMREPLNEWFERRHTLQSFGYGIPNGIIVIHNVDDLTIGA